MNELAVPIITGLITAGTTVIVCLINNYVILKKDRKARDQEFLKDMNDIRKSNEKAIQEIKEDFFAHMEELVATQSEVLNKIEIIEVRHTNLCAAVEKHNNVIERTFKLEEKMALAEEKQRVANHRINDLETETRELRKHE